MKAIGATRYGSPDVLESRDVPKPSIKERVPVHGFPLDSKRATLCSLARRFGKNGIARGELRSALAKLREKLKTEWKGVLTKEPLERAR